MSGEAKRKHDTPKKNEIKLGTMTRAIKRININVQRKRHEKTQNTKSLKINTKAEKQIKNNRSKDIFVRYF
jgi:hypothetical protein